VKPQHIIHPVTMPPGSEEANVFKALVGRLEHALEIHATTMIILELYLRIRQFMAHPIIYVEALRRKYSREEYKREGWTGTASKVEAFKKFLQDAPKEPTIVFATFKTEMDIAELSLRNAGYTVYSIRGGMTDALREQATKGSKEDCDAGKAVAIVVQIVSGGAGLNLQHCSRVFFLSSHWNPAVVDQAIARAYRIGQTKTVEVHHLIIADSAEKNIDRLMAQLHGEKRSLAIAVHSKLFCDSALEGEAIWNALGDSEKTENTENS
jgi:SNF2 family DNA or RNA helicase